MYAHSPQKINIVFSIRQLGLIEIWLNVMSGILKISLYKEIRVLFSTYQQKPQGFTLK